MEFQYVDMLKDEFFDRKSRRSSYSERAFARDIRVSSGFVSLLFRRQRTLSAKKGLEIANRLNWPDTKVNHFIALIQKAHLYSAQLQNRKAKGSTEPAPYREIEIDTFRHMSDLNHFAVLTLVQTRDVISAAKVTRELGIPEMEADLILKRLVRLGLIKFEKGRFCHTTKHTEVMKVSADAVRAFHHQALQRAESAIEGQALNSRNFSSLTLAFDRAQMADAIAFITKFLKAFDKKFGNCTEGEIYLLNTQLFSLVKEAK
jgi:uncharacterized protein (TIGR02147 family)